MCWYAGREQQTRGHKVQFGLLGALLVHDGQTPRKVPAAKQRTILAALLLSARRAVGVDRLTDLLWEGVPPAGSQTTLRNHVMRLRNSLGPAAGGRIRFRAPGYLIEIGEDELDVECFAALHRQGLAAARAGQWDAASTRLQQALALWRDEPLQDIPCQQLRDDHRDHLAEQCIQALALRIEADLRLGDRLGLVAELQKLTTAEPFRENLVGLLMQALYAEGRRAEALESFRQARRRLAAELDVEPGPELRELHRRIRTDDPGLLQNAHDAVTVIAAPAQDAPAKSTSRNDLPRDLADFTGRAPQIDCLIQELSQAAASGIGAPVMICSITGIGGVGKTTLAVHTGHALAHHYEDGQLYANLLGTSPTPMPSTDVLARFLRRLGVEEPKIPLDIEERAATYRSALAGRRVLVVLDDVRDAAQVRPLLPGTSGCGVLITSRSRLPGLDGSTRLNLDVFSQAEAEDLFTRILGDRGADLDPEAAAQILACCGGLPLAIRIAAARLVAQPCWTPRMLADELSDHGKVLDGLQIEDRGVRPSFALSHASLNAETARGFALLGLWPGAHIPFGAACALFNLDERQTRRILDALTAVNLLDSSEPERYRCHDLIKVYAAERAHATLSPTVKKESIGRMTAWFLEAITAATALLEPGQRRPATVTEHSATQLAAIFPDAPTALAWCDRERSNLAAAVAAAARAGYDAEAWKTAVAAQAYYHRGCHWADWEDTHHIALAAARRLSDRFAEAWALNGLGLLRIRTRRLDEGTELLLQAQTIRRAIGDQPGLAQTVSNLGIAYSAIGQEHADPTALEKAVECYRSGAALFEEAGQEYAAATPLTNLGSAYYELGRYDEAARQLTAALELDRRVGNRPGEAAALHGLGEVAARDDLPTARTFYEQAISVRQAIGDRVGETVVLKALAEIDLKEGAAAAAALTLERAAGLIKDIDPAESEDLRRRAARLQASARRRGL
jgi:DNA-binding SARP family transcriptional activator